MCVCVCVCVWHFEREALVCSRAVCRTAFVLGSFEMSNCSTLRRYEIRWYDLIRLARELTRPTKSRSFRYVLSICVKPFGISKLKVALELPSMFVYECVVIIWITLFAKSECVVFIADRTSLSRLSRCVPATSMTSVLRYWHLVDQSPSRRVFRTTATRPSWEIRRRLRAVSDLSEIEWVRIDYMWRDVFK